MPSCAERLLPRRLQARLAERRGGLQPRIVRGRRSSPSLGRPSAIAPDETTQTGSPAPTSDASSPRARVNQFGAHLAVLPHDEPGSELDDDRLVQRVWVPSPTTRYWRSQRSR